MHRFAAASACPPAISAATVDFTSFNDALAKALSKLTGQPCRTLADIEGSANAAPAGEFVWYSTGTDWLGIALPITLAEALVGQRYGGDLIASAGLHSHAPSVRGLHAEVVAAILGVAAAHWLTLGREWTAAKPPMSSLTPPALQAITIGVGALSLPLTIALALASPASSTSAPEGWAADLRRSLEHVAFPVRAVLFETRLPLARAVQLRPGDVLPIETPRDVGLRVGAHRLGSGSIAPTGDGGHRVTIRASARPFGAPANTETSQ